VYIFLVPDDFLPFEQGLFILFTLCAAYTFATSALYHWFCCLNSDTFYDLARFDMSGIALLIGGSMVVPLYYAFRCDQTISTIYMGTIVTLTGSMILLFLIPSLSTEHYRNLRICIFTAFGIGGFVPIVHLSSFYGIFSEFLYERIKTVSLMYATYTFGLFFYFSRIPERIFQRTFDIFFHSHQIWHVAVSTASLIHFYNMYEFRDASISRSCILGRLSN
jgi:adiponectin receptor